AANGASQPAAAYINTSTSAQGTNQLPLNTWTHLAATYDGSSLLLYQNGILVGSMATSGNISTTTGVLRIGGNLVYGAYFQGLIDDVRVYSRALTPGEIATDMSTPVGGSVDTTAPVVTMNTPSVNGSVTTLSAVATDNAFVAGVQ